jgi:hypothetical protein
MQARTPLIAIVDGDLLVSPTLVSTLSGPQGLRMVQELATTK